MVFDPLLQSGESLIELEVLAFADHEYVAGVHIGLAHFEVGCRQTAIVAAYDLNRKGVNVRCPGVLAVDSEEVKAVQPEAAGGSR